MSLSINSKYFYTKVWISRELMPSLLIMHFWKKFYDRRAYLKICFSHGIKLISQESKWHVFIVSKSLIKKVYFGCCCVETRKNTWNKLNLFPGDFLGSCPEECSSKVQYFLEVQEHNVRWQTIRDLVSNSTKKKKKNIYKLWLDFF